MLSTKMDKKVERLDHLFKYTSHPLQTNLDPVMKLFFPFVEGIVMQ